MLVKSMIVYSGAKKGDVANRMKIKKRNPCTKDLLEITFTICITLFSQNTCWLGQEQNHEDDIIGYKG